MKTPKRTTKDIGKLIEQNVLGNNKENDNSDIKGKGKKGQISKLSKFSPISPEKSTGRTNKQAKNNILPEKKEEQVFIIGKVKKSYLTESDILRALELNTGVLSETARSLKTSYNRLREFIESSPRLKQAAEEVSEIKKDLAESKLNEHIRNGNLTAITFFLKTKAKDRGYVESMDFNLPNKPIYFVYKEVKPKEVK